VNKAELVKELQRLGWLLPPRKDGKSTHQRWTKGKAKYYFVFGKRENSGEGSEGSEGSSLNACGDEVIDPFSNLHYSKNTSEGSEGSSPKIDTNLHYLHKPSPPSEGEVKAENASAGCILDSPSLPSLPSPQKTGLGESIPGNNPKVGSQEYGEADMLSIAQTLESVAQMPETQAKETLKELYSVWKSVDMQKASAQLKAMNPEAFDILRKLVAALKLSGELEVAN
jgi:hypothetical protein